MKQFTEEFSNKFVELAELVVGLKRISIFLEFSTMLELIELRNLRLTKKEIPEDLAVRLSELENYKNIVDLLEKFQHPSTEENRRMYANTCADFECFLNLEKLPEIFEEIPKEYLQKNKELREHKDAPSKLSKDFELKPEEVKALENFAKNISDTLERIKRIRKICNQ
ncbi:hypothetical protein KAI56_03885 [Candidatus Parcubacteria bacterium]|nr:hypothetical protein [Candidatus Parcubacteria bacterium]